MKTPEKVIDIDKWNKLALCGQSLIIRRWNQGFLIFWSEFTQNSKSIRTCKLKNFHRCYISFWIKMYFVLVWLQICLNKTSSFFDFSLKSIFNIYETFERYKDIDNGKKKVLNCPHLIFMFFLQSISLFNMKWNCKSNQYRCVGQ